MYFVVHVTLVSSILAHLYVVGSCTIGLVENAAILPGLSRVQFSGDALYSPHF